VASAPIQARPADDGRLIVNRSADFGGDESINSPSTASKSRSGIIRITMRLRRKHVVSITTNPKTYGEQVRVNSGDVEPGKTYTLLRFGRSERASLVEQ